MTDDNLMGKVFCCIPLRYFVGAVALFLFLYGILNVAYIFMQSLLHLGQQTPPHCVGNACLEILSCDGLQDATMHVRMAVLILGGVAFGGYGTIGSINNHPPELRWLATYLYGLGVIFGAEWFCDLLYSGICGRYTQNVVDLAVLWPALNYPMREGFKFEIRVSSTYPTSWVDLTAGFDVFRLYTAVVFLWMAFFVYAASRCQVLAHFSDHGVFGLGANHDVGVWREQLLFQREVASQFQDAATMARLTIQDIGWRPDDDLSNLAYANVSYGAAERDVEQHAGGKVNYRSG